MEPKDSEEIYLPHKYQCVHADLQNIPFYHMSEQRDPNKEWTLHKHMNSVWLVWFGKLNEIISNGVLFCTIPYWKKYFINTEIMLQNFHNKE
jgi:hypothetical protein